MEKTRDLFKKIKDTKGTFHAKMGSIKDRNCMDLTEAEDTKKRLQLFTLSWSRNSAKSRDFNRRFNIKWCAETGFRNAGA